MKLLPKQEINKAKAQERKQEIDTGLALAKRVDELRESKSKEEVQLRAWRIESIAKIQKEIDSYIEVKDNLKKQTEEAEAFRKEMIKPLDEEWLKVNTAKQMIDKDRELIHQSKDSLREQAEKIKATLSKVSDISTRTKHKEDEADKAKKEAIALKDLAQHEYEKARNQTEIQSIHNSEVNTRLAEKEREYEVGIQTNKLKAKILEEKESELIIREKELQRQQNNLRITAEAMKLK